MNIILYLLLLIVSLVLLLILLQYFSLKHLKTEDLNYLLHSTEEERIKFLEAKGFQLKRGYSSLLMIWNPLENIEFVRAGYNDDSVLFEHKLERIISYSNSIPLDSGYHPVDIRKPFIRYGLPTNRYRTVKRIALIFRILMHMLSGKDNPAPFGNYADDFLNELKQEGFNEVVNPDFDKEGFSWMEIASAPVENGWLHHSGNTFYCTLLKKEKAAVLTLEYYESEKSPFSFFFYYES